MVSDCEKKETIPGKKGPIKWKNTKLIIAKDKKELMTAIIVSSLFVLNTAYMIVKWLLISKVS